MRVYNTPTCNYLVKAVTPDLVLYDVVFPLNKENELDRKEREILGVGPDLQRNTNHNCTMATDRFAVRLAVSSGHYLDATDPGARKVIASAIKEQFNA